MIILIVFLTALLLFIISKKLKSKGLGLISFILLVILCASIFNFFEDEIYDFIDNCSLPLFWGLSFLSIITGSILSDITIVYILNSIFSIDSVILKVLSIFLIPIIVIISALVLFLIFGTAIGFPFAVNFISKNRKSHSFFTLFSSAVYSLLFMIAISHSGNFYLLADSLHVF